MAGKKTAKPRGKSTTRPSSGHAARNPERRTIRAGSTTPEKPSSSQPGTLLLDQQEIERRAYKIFESRGYAHGNDVSDWLEAERQLRDESSPRRAPARRAGGLKQRG